MGNEAERIDERVGVFSGSDSDNWWKYLHWRSWLGPIDHVGGILGRWVWVLGYGEERRNVCGAFVSRFHSPYIDHTLLVLL